MNCPHCPSQKTKGQNKKTMLGYQIFRCSVCTRRFNERSGTLFNFLEYPTDLVLLAVLLRFAPLLADQLRTTRRGQAGRSWYVDAHVRQSPWKVVLPLPRHRS